MLHYHPDLKDVARRLRRDATFPERLLWSRLRRRQLGQRFMRQRPIGRYAVDFCCIEACLVIELDGRSHDGQIAYDAERQRALEAQGLHVLRFSNDEVVAGIDSVIERIGACLAERVSVSEKLPP